MKKVVLWAIPAAAVLGALGGVLYMKSTGGATAPAAADSQPADAAKADASHIKLTAEQVEHAGIKTEAIQKGTLAADIRAFGVIQEDPGASFIVRAEAPGLIQSADGKGWPDVGQMLPDGAVIGVLQPRVIPSDQLTLSSQRVTLEGQVTTAQADLNTANIALDAAKAAYERLKGLNAQDKNVSDRVVEEALAKVKTEEAHRDGADKALALAKTALDSVKMKLEPMPLKIEHGGEVVEVNAHPGEAIESGQPILRVATFDHVVAAIDVPPDQNPAADVNLARIVPLGENEKPLSGTRMGTAELTDPKTRDRVLMFRVPIDKNTNLRPGHPVVAYLPAPGDPLQGVTIPETAIVRYQGKGWVYVADDATTFERREVPLDHPSATGDGWFVNAGFKGDEALVVTGAQVLLSNEVNAAFAGG